jgi:hypothetical protein
LIVDDNKTDKRGSASSVTTEDKDNIVSGMNLGQAASVTLPNVPSLDIVDNDVVDDFEYPLGSARAVQVNSSVLPSSGHCPSEFSVIIDSGAAAMMMPFHHCFITYKPTPKSYVILADSQKSPCLGRGDVCITMGFYSYFKGCSSYTKPSLSSFLCSMSSMITCLFFPG